MKKINRYDIIEELGRGGMGVVYKAYDPEIDREVAIKVILKIELEDKELKARFIREARTAGKLSHENITIVLGGGAREFLSPFSIFGNADFESLSISSIAPKHNPLHAI